MLGRQVFVKNSYTEFQENSTFSLVADSRSRKDGQTAMISTQAVHFSFRKERVITGKISTLGTVQIWVIAKLRISNGIKFN
jgi:hypothetical protein